MNQEQLNELAARDYNLFVQYMIELVDVQKQTIVHQSEIIATLSGTIRPQLADGGVTPFWLELSVCVVESKISTNLWQDFDDRWDDIYRNGVSHG